jgi:hypothetical protein
MKISTTRTPRKDWATGPMVTAAGLALAIAGLLGASPLRAEDGNHNDQHQQQQQQQQHHQQPQHHQQQPQQSQRHGNDSRQTYNHQDHGHGDYNDNQNYVYAPPPVVYEPAPAAGITLVLPIQFR